ncbi:MAG: SpvB/TcaC N-terminal domain-containing protein, partial [Aestuariivirga sp.]|uniref:SpvB/TcaC N-terminal domain-containing protein n=1 Tax=Aestuariivirga sp. TaxID=2650926 RepID=UPI003018B7C6
MRAALTIAILGLISSLAFAQSDADTKEPKLPTEGRNGSFSRVIPIEVPAFRGLEPDLKLVYDSSSGIRNLPPAGGELGTGWTLQGVSAIQRISGTPAPMAGQNKAPSGRGVPAYGAAGFPTDSFALDGTELVPCTEVASPASTPSCATASSLQTAYSGRFETFMRIRANPSSNSWEVTSRDGVKSTYTSLEGGPSEVTFRWHLSSVTDRRGNHVDYGWNCAFGHCTISTIRAFSAGTGAPASEIVFHTQDRPDRITYGDGRGMRAMSKRITAIEIRSGGQLRGAYALGYETSASTRLSRLTEVRKYGVDAAISGGTVTGGTSLPPWRMSYTNNGDAAGHPVFDKRQDWTGPGIAALKPAKDFDSIGFPIDYPQSAELVGDFNGDGWDTDAYLPKLCIAATLPPVPNPRGGVGNPRPAYVCIENRLRLANGNPSGASFSLISIQSAKTAGKLPDSDRITALGDFNGDGATDFARAWSTAQEDCQSDQCARTWKFSGVTVKSLVGGGGGEGFGTVYDDVKMKSANGKAGDFDGDGKDDFLLEDGRIALSGRGRASVVNWGLNNIDS